VYANTYASLEIAHEMHIVLSNESVVICGVMTFAIFIGGMVLPTHANDMFRLGLFQCLNE
jgi:hypothetical protein